MTKRFDRQDRRPFRMRPSPPATVEEQTAAIVRAVEGILGLHAKNGGDIDYRFEFAVNTALWEYWETGAKPEIISGPRFSIHCDDHLLPGRSAGRFDYLFAPEAPEEEKEA